MPGELVIPNGIIASGSFIITGSLMSTQTIFAGGSAVVTSNQTGSFASSSVQESLLIAYAIALG